MKKKNRRNPLSLSVRPIDRISAKILGGDEKNKLAETNPDAALEECLNPNPAFEKSRFVREGRRTVVV